jgi:chromosomal replication initiator protein
MSVKKDVRAHLARFCTEEELHSWYDPLHIEMDQEESCIMVTFPHHLFGPWFVKTGQETLEAGLAACLGKDIFVRYVADQQHAESYAQISENRVQNDKPFGENFTLDNFLFNKKNFYPMAVAREVTKSQKEPEYNPLMYYGQSGSGKTHILRAIANELSKTCDYHAVFYGNISKFADECDNGKDINGYNFYFIDDIHLIANDISLQEKLVLFLDACLYEKKQFICSCYDSLASHRGFSDSLRSRLEHGLKVELKNPDLDVRMRFVHIQCMLHNITLAREHMLLLTQRCENLRYLSGVLMNLAAYKKLAQREIAKQDIETILQQSIEYSPVTPHDIISQVAAYFSLPADDITGTRRKPALVFARQMAMYLCRDILGTSYPVIGQMFGGKDHSTVMYSIKKIEQYLITNKNAHTEITKLKNLCSQKNN